MKRKRKVFKSIICVAVTFCILIVLVIVCMCKTSSSKNVKVKIGVIDSYISEETLQELKVDEFVNYTKDFDESKNMHGITTLKIIQKECSNCEIFYASVLNEKNVTSIENLVNAIDWCMEKNVDIICMSLSTTVNDILLEKIIEKAITKNIIITAACINFSKDMCYPAMYDGVISVSEGVNENATIIIRDKIFKIKENGKVVNKTGTSVLNAYVCGCIGKQFSKGNNDIEDIISQFS